MDDAAKLQKQKEQVEKATELQDLILDDFIAMAKAGTLTSTDRATIVRLLAANGWSLDPNQLPQHLKDKLTSSIDPCELDEDEPRLRVV